jgi:hypothetical protein
MSNSVKGALLFASLCVVAAIVVGMALGHSARYIAGSAVVVFVCAFVGVWLVEGRQQRRRP